MGVGARRRSKVDARGGAGRRGGRWLWWFKCLWLAALVSDSSGGLAFLVGAAATGWAGDWAVGAGLSGRWALATVGGRATRAPGQPPSQAAKGGIRQIPDNASPIGWRQGSRICAWLARFPATTPPPQSSGIPGACLAASSFVCSCVPCAALPPCRPQVNGLRGAFSLCANHET